MLAPSPTDPACLPATPAAKCLVEVVVEMYREGVTLDDAKVMLSLASLQHGGQLLKPMDEVG